MDKLNRFYFSDNLSIDNALSTNHIIHQLINQYNKLIDFLNDLEFDYKSYVDGEIVKLHNQINTQLSELENVLNDKIELNSLDINELKSRADLIETNIANIMLDITQFKSDVENEFNDVRNEISTVFNSLQAELLSLKNYVDDLIKRMTVKVYSNYDGCKKDVKSALNDLYQYCLKAQNTSCTVGNLKQILNVYLYETVNDVTITDYVKNVVTIGDIKTVLNNKLFGLMWYTEKVTDYTASQNVADDSLFNDCYYLLSGKPSILRAKRFLFDTFFYIILNVLYSKYNIDNNSKYNQRTLFGKYIKLLSISYGNGRLIFKPRQLFGWDNY